MNQREIEVKPVPDLFEEGTGELLVGLGNHEFKIATRCAETIS